MPLWGKNGSQASNSVFWGAASINQGSTAANKSSNNTALFQNTTVGAWVVGNSSSANGAYQNSVQTAPINQVIGQFAVSKSQHKDGYVNVAYLAVPTISAPGGGYNNTDYIIASNGVINAYLNVSTNASGNISSLTFTPGTGGLSGQGQWANNVANNTVVLTVYAANGAATNGTSATLVANLVVQSGEGNRVTGNPGWAMRRAGEGPIVTVPTVANGVFTNGEHLLASNGSVNAYLVLTTNATGNLVSASLQQQKTGLFPNTSALVYTFVRDQHLGSPPASVVQTAYSQLNKATISANGGGYSNTDYVVASNGAVNAIFVIVTSVAGGNIATITVNALASGPGGNGLWLASDSNTYVKFTVYAQNGAASNGTAATFVGNLTAWATALYTNTDYVVVSNGLVNAVLTVATSTSGNISALAINATASGVGGAGLWANSGTFGGTGNLVFVAYAANGAASNGYGAVYTGNLVTSTGGGVNTTSTVLGGRAGRVTYETLAVVKGISNGQNSNLPNT